MGSSPGVKGRKSAVLERHTGGGERNPSASSIASAACELLWPCFFSGWEASGERRGGFAGRGGCGASPKQRAVVKLVWDWPRGRCAREGERAMEQERDHAAGTINWGRSPPPHAPVKASRASGRAALCKGKFPRKKRRVRKTCEAPKRELLDWRWGNGSTLGSSKRDRRWEKLSLPPPSALLS